jgi:hypothetical protein
MYENILLGNLVIVTIMTVKGKIFPFYAMMAYRGVEVSPHSFLTLAVDGDA